MQQRNSSLSKQCEYADRLERVTTILFSRISERMSPSNWDACRTSLERFYQALSLELKERGRFHYVSAAGSPHTCLPQAYESAKATLDILEQTPLPLPPAPPPRPQRRSLTDLLTQFAEREADSQEEEGHDTL